jgi:hypothetical protein
MMDVWAADMERRDYVNDEIGKGDEKELIIPGPIRIGDEKWDAAEVTWNVKTVVANSPRIDPQYMGAGFKFQAELSKANFKRIEGTPNNIIPLFFSVLVNEYNTWEDVYDFVDSDIKSEIYPVLAHELKHAFDHRKQGKKGIKAQSRGRYETVANAVGIQSLYDFNYKVYYTHFLENLVRPSEFLAQLENEKVTKKEFLSTLRNNRIYTKLQSIQNYSYDELINNIINDPSAISFISRRISDDGGDVDQYSKIELAKEVLKLNYEEVIEIMREKYINQAIGNSFREYSAFLNDTLSDINKEKNDAMEEVLADISRFGDNYEAFYKYEIKKMNILAGKTIRKLARIYDYLP